MQNRDRLIDGEQMRAVGGRFGGGGTEQKQKRLMDMDNSVVIAGGRAVYGD